MEGVLQSGVFLALLIVSVSSETPCSPSNRQTNLTECLSNITVAFLNSSAFWFGNDYSINCPNGPASGGLACSNPRPGRADSMATRLLTFNASLLTSYLDMTFTSAPEEYRGCGNVFSPTEVRTITIDPLADDTFHPWDMRHLPTTLTWTYTPGSLYTIIIYDVGYLITHGIYINIEGTDMASAEVIDPYHGPLATQDLVIPYVFMVFEQQSRISVPQEWMAKLMNPMSPFNFDDLIQDFNLTGPIGMNWIKVTGDEYAADLMRTRGILNMCPIYVGKALDQHDRPFISSPVDLKVSINITFNPEALSYSVCCKNYSYGAVAHVLNPIGNGTFSTAEVRSEANPTVSLMKLGIMMNSAAVNFTGDKYSLIALDPDVPHSTVGTEELPLLHWMVLNIEDGDVTTGDVIVPYGGPTPPDNNHHTYYFLLYQHEADLTAQEVRSYSGVSCPDHLVGRCLYNLTGLAGEHNMTLVGATWMKAVRDDYVIYRYINNGRDADVECAGQEGYGNPCPTSAAESVVMTTMTAYVTCFITFLIGHVMF